MALYKKFRNEIRQRGFFYFIKLKLTEQFYKRKFKGLGIEYSEDATTAEAAARQSAHKDSKRNSSSPYYELKKAFSVTGIQYSDICLLDIGCGDGKALNFGMLLNFKQVTGIDLDPDAIRSATNNCYQMQKKGYTTKSDVLHIDASTYAIPDGTNIIYLFNPFGKKTMEDVVNNIVDYLNNYRKEFYVIYSVPVHLDLFVAQKKFVKIYERFNGPKTQSEMAIFKISGQ